MYLLEIVRTWDIVVYSRILLDPEKCSHMEF